MNTFEQVFSDAHQILLAEGTGTGRVPCPMYGGLGWGSYVWKRLVSEVQCIMDNDHMGTHFPSAEQNDRQTSVKTPVGTCQLDRLTEMTGSG